VGTSSPQADLKPALITLLFCMKNKRKPMKTYELDFAHDYGTSVTIAPLNDSLSKMRALTLRVPSGGTPRAQLVCSHVRVAYFMKFTTCRELSGIVELWQRIYQLGSAFSSVRPVAQRKNVRSKCGATRHGGWRQVFWRSSRGVRCYIVASRAESF
jgi:hypothetical protein